MVTLFWLSGSLLLAVSFPFLFSPSLLGDGLSQWWHFGYYVGIDAVLVVGLMICQVAHLSIVPDLTSNGREQTELSTVRYVTGLFGWSLTSPEHASGYMRHPCKGHGVGCLSLILLSKPNTGGDYSDMKFTDNFVESGVCILYHRRSTWPAAELYIVTYR